MYLKLCLFPVSFCVPEMQIWPSPPSTSIFWCNSVHFLILWFHSRSEFFDLVCSHFTWHSVQFFGLPCIYFTIKTTATTFFTWEKIGFLFFKKTQPVYFWILRVRVYAIGKWNITHKANIWLLNWTLFLAWFKAIRVRIPFWFTGKNKNKFWTILLGAFRVTPPKTRVH